MLHLCDALHGHIIQTGRIKDILLICPSVQLGVNELHWGKPVRHTSQWHKMYKRETLWSVNTEINYYKAAEEDFKPIVLH